MSSTKKLVFMSCSRSAAPAARGVNMELVGIIGLETSARMSVV
jgi:hypothetical protein